jgi:hypothetical protein
VYRPSYRSRRAYRCAAFTPMWSRGSPRYLQRAGPLRKGAIPSEGAAPDWRFKAEK